MSQVNITFKSFGAKGFATGAVRKALGFQDVGDYVCQLDGKWGFWMDAKGCILAHKDAIQDKPEPLSDAELDGGEVDEVESAGVSLAGAGVFGAMAAAALAVASKPAAPRRGGATVDGYTIEKNRPESNGIRRPSAGGLCRQVWDFCQHVVDSEGVEALSVRVVKDRAADVGWNINNAVIEFYQWRKFNGITGRSKPMAAELADKAAEV